MRGAKTNGPGHYDVGYGKPPPHNRFEPGKSGNPRGRPKGARGKQNQLLDAMDQPTREMFMAEMHRPINVTSDGKTVEMPTIQVITRAMVKSAAEGGQQAQRTAIMLQLELERDAAKRNAEFVSLAREVKELGERALTRARAKGLPDPELVPHPEDIFIDEQRQRAEIRGPWTDEQKKALDKLLAHRDGYQRGVLGFQAQAAAKPSDWTLLVWASSAQEAYDYVNDLLPQRYRKKLEGRMTEGQIKRAQDRGRKVLREKRKRARQQGSAAKRGPRRD